MFLRSFYFRIKMVNNKVVNSGINIMCYVMICMPPLQLESRINIVVIVVVVAVIIIIVVVVVVIV